MSVLLWADGGPLPPSPLPLPPSRMLLANCRLLPALPSPLAPALGRWAAAPRSPLSSSTCFGPNRGTSPLPATPCSGLILSPSPSPRSPPLHLHPPFCLPCILSHPRFGFCRLLHVSVSSACDLLLSDVIPSSSVKRTKKKLIWCSY